MISKKPMRCTLALVSFMITFASCQSFAAGSTTVLFWQGTYQSALDMAKQLHKPMMLSFNMPNDYENQLDTITFRDPRVAYFVGATCLAYQIKTYSVDSDAKALIAHFKVHYFPTIIVTDSDGNEIDRMIGYYPPAQFIYYIENFINNHNTVGDLKRRLASDTSNIIVAFQLASRFELRIDLDSAMHYFEYVIFHGQDSSLLVQRAKYHLGDFHLKVFGNPFFLYEFIDRTHVDSLRYSAYHEVIDYYQKTKMRDSLLAVYSRAIRAYPRDDDFLNNYAWELATTGGNLDSAQAYVSKAISLDPSVPDYYDTRAEIYMHRRQFDKALAQIQKALRLKHNDPYLIEREDKCRAALEKSKN